MRIGAPKGAQAWKILYRSTLSTGEPVAVSGFVVVPKRRLPAGGWPVVAWAHGTEGGGRNCAPWLAPDPARELIDFFTYESPYQYVAKAEYVGWIADRFAGRPAPSNC